ERFTMDEGLSNAVKEVFVRLYKEDLIYRGKRLVNWDPKLRTAISDLEVENRESKGSMWHIRYPLADGAKTADGKDYLVVATTRPETMLGDAAVAVHPEDERYKNLIGRHVMLPLVNRLIPIVADDYVDLEFGTGCVKITPAHDFNDYEVGKRHQLPLINIFDQNACVLARAQVFNIDGTVNDKIDGSLPDGYAHMDRFDARKAIVARAEEEGWLREIEKTKHMVPHGDRSGVVIEPWMTDQWYVDAKVMAQPALKAVEDGATVFEPKSYEKIYFEWLRNIEPWCISRQLWWGHRIPAWYGPNGEIYVAETEEDAREQALSDYDSEVVLTQDEDVLDTWFSSALWPFSTMGWPEKTEDLERFYPTSDLVTAADIIFFWVARMMMMGLHFMDGEVPFKRVIINGLVRDEKGQKMSKSKGNVIDPLNIIDELGADPLRFTMAILSGTRDIKLSKQRIEGYRNFGTKLWNAARFSQMNEARRVEGFDPAGVQQTINRWIRGELTKAERQVSDAIEGGRFDDAAGALYRFIWNVFCDWYLELAKPVFNGSNEAAKAETRAMTAWTIDQTLKLLHPVMPYITEELWAELGREGPARDGLLMGETWPVLPDAFVDANAEAEIGWLVDLIGEIRALRAEMNVPPSAKPPLAFVGPDTVTAERIARHRDLILTLGRVSEVAVAEAAPTGAVTFVSGGATVALSLAGIIDLAAERARLEKEIAAFDSDIGHVNKKLGNPNFVSRAAPEVVDEQRAKLAEAEEGKARLQAALKRLESL
ncbi:MAG TPA: valine--tRNA ligase, partial [Brevundimonas sp.]|nr:valine--tRNA ligase [Brevundimonas sp.]